MFKKLANQLFPHVASLWSINANSLLSALSSFSKNEISGTDLQSLYPAAEALKFSIKILRRLLIYGIPKFNENQTAVDFLKHLLFQLENWVKCRKLIGSIQLNFLFVINVLNEY